MAEIRTLKGMNDAGYDPDRSLLVVPVGKTTTLYLVDTSVLGTSMEIEEEQYATLVETEVPAAQSKRQGLQQSDRGHPVTKMVVKGVAVGETRLVAEATVGSDRMEPVTVRVVDNPEYSQAPVGRAITPGFRDELAGLPTLRTAVLRVAEDQMFSLIGRSGGRAGFGRFHPNGTYDWCGAFAHYCWQTACDARGVPNPFGDSNRFLLSALKAVSWVLQTGKATLLRYEGGDPYGNSFVTGKPLPAKEQKTQKFIGIDAAHPVLPADILLLRTGKASGWRHVALVAETPGADECHSYDGNQVAHQGQTITTRTRDMRKMVPGGGFELVFIHVNV